MSCQVVFIGGIHGVGKSYFCSKLQNKLNIAYYSASEIIKKYKNFLSTNKKVSDIEMLDNQQLLIQGLNYIKKSNEKLLLDGHFVLLDKNDNIIRIPQDTFEYINPQKIILFIDTPQNIYQRLLDRDNKTYDVNLLDDMQQEEINQAKIVAKQLKIPCIIIDINELDDIEQLLYSEIK
jgi:adenylate kinase